MSFKIWTVDESLDTHEDFLGFYEVQILKTGTTVAAIKDRILTLFRMGFFGAAHGWRGGRGGRKRTPLPKICHTYPTMMKLGSVIPYLKKIQKLYESRDTPLEFCWHQHFLPEISKFCYIKKYRYRFQLDT